MRPSAPVHCPDAASLKPQATGRALAATAGVRRLRVSLGTLVAIEAVADSTSSAAAAVDAAFAEITAIERRLHPLSPASDLARINNAPLQTPVGAHRDTFELLKLARRLHDMTAGLFDPCLPSRPGRLADIEIAPSANDPQEGPACNVICHAPVALDFGGFAKGYAVDRAVERLISHGCGAGLVNAGGDLRVFGPRAEPVFIRRPSGEITPVSIADSALAVSDVDCKRRPPEHRGYYVRRHEGTHRDDTPLAARYAAVKARLAVIADALVKCVLLCPRETAEPLLRQLGANRI